MRRLRGGGPINPLSQNDARVTTGLFTVAEAAAHLGISPSTLRWWTGDGHLVTRLAVPQRRSSIPFIGLMKDAVHRIEAQREVMERHEVEAFLLVNRHLKGEEQCAFVVANLNRIIQRSRRPGPFVYGSYKDRLKKVWPPT